MVFSTGGAGGATGAAAGVDEGAAATGAGREAVGTTDDGVSDESGEADELGFSIQKIGEGDQTPCLTLETLGRIRNAVYVLKPYNPTRTCQTRRLPQYPGRTGNLGLRPSSKPKQILGVKPCIRGSMRSLSTPQKNSGQNKRRSTWFGASRSSRC